TCRCVARGLRVCALPTWTGGRHRACPGRTVGGGGLSDGEREVAVLPVASAHVAGTDAGGVTTYCSDEGPGGSAQGAWRRGRAARFVADGGRSRRAHGGTTEWARQAPVCRP